MRGVADTMPVQPRAALDEMLQLLALWRHANDPSSGATETGFIALVRTRIIPAVEQNASSHKTHATPARRRVVEGETNREPTTIQYGAVNLVDRHGG